MSEKLDRYLTLLGFITLATLVFTVFIDIVLHFAVTEIVENNYPGGMAACKELTRVEAHEALNRTLCAYLRSH